MNAEQRRAAFDLWTKIMGLDRQAVVTKGAKSKKIWGRRAVKRFLVSSFLPLSLVFISRP